MPLSNNVRKVTSENYPTDAGREGELIFRLVYEHAGCKKPMERLWISSMEDAAIRDGFEHLRPGSDYDKLYDAAVCRAGADWLIGINATRLFSVLYGVTLNVGRVMSPTLALLVQREADIRAFTSKPFYVPEITCGGFTASGEKLSGKNEAEKICMDCDGQGALVLSVEKQVKTVQPPRLYDLTTLQRECNRIYGYTAQQTLDYVQSLYEKKLATYPRTDSQYLTEDMQATAASLVLWLRDYMPFGKGCTGEPDIDRVTDGSKVTDHHAIIPTVEVARTDLSELPSGERDVLTLIAARLLSATAQAHRFEAVTAVLDCRGNSFTAKGKTVLQAGWKEVERLYRMGLKQSKPEDDESTDASLPMLQEGQVFETVSASVREGRTSPPKHYTDVERGERGSTEEHLTVTQFKVQREQERLDALTAQADEQAQTLAKTCQTLSKKEKELAAVQKKTTLTKEALIHVRDLDYIGKRTFLGNYSLTEEEFSKLKNQADHGYMMDVENRRLKEELSTAKKEAAHWGQKYHELWYEVKPYLDALHRAPELVRGFLEKILAPKQERTVNAPQRNRKRGQDMEL